MDLNYVNTGNYSCIHCGAPINKLYKKYSATVLKLTECVRISIYS